MRTFEEIAEAQGWNVDSQLQLLRQYVANQNDDAALAAFAEEAAKAENPLSAMGSQAESDVCWACRRIIGDAIVCPHCGKEQ